MEWSRINSLKADSEKFEFMVLQIGQVSSYNLFIDAAKNVGCEEVTLLGIITDNKLKFKKHIKDLCKKGYHEVHALRKLKLFLTVAMIANLIMLPWYGCLEVKRQPVRFVKSITVVQNNFT